MNDFVYVKHPALDTLDCSASPIIVQSIKIRHDYTLVFRGRDGRVITDHAWNSAPCYLPDVSNEYDPARVRPEVDHTCEVCLCIESLDWMLRCDGRNRGYHMEYVTPPMTEVPLGEWYCTNHLDVPAAPLL